MCIESTVEREVWRKACRLMQVIIMKYESEFDNAESDRIQEEFKRMKGLSML